MVTTPLFPPSFAPQVPLIRKMRTAHFRGALTEKRGFRWRNITLARVQRHAAVPRSRYAAAQNFCPDRVKPFANTTSIACRSCLVMPKNFIAPSRTFALLFRAKSAREKVFACIGDRFASIASIICGSDSLRLFGPFRFLLEAGDTPPLKIGAE